MSAADRTTDATVPVVEGMDIVRLLGEGGMGRVYLGSRRADGRAVACKILRPVDPTTEARALARFRRETDLCRTFDHPNVATFLDSVVHRDVKPANVVLAPDGRFVIIDFGVALAVDQTRITATAEAVGSLAFLAPEQVQNGTIDGRTDLFGLAATLYLAATGRAPYEGATVALWALGGERPPSPPRLVSLRPDLAPSLATLLERNLSLVPDDRFASARTSRTFLDRPSWSSTAPATEEARVPAPRTTAAPPVAMPRRPVLVATAALAVALLLVAVTARQPESSPGRPGVAPPEPRSSAVEPSTVERLEMLAATAPAEALPRLRAAVAAEPSGDDAVRLRYCRGRRRLRDFHRRFPKHTFVHRELKGSTEVSSRPDEAVAEAGRLLGGITRFAMPRPSRLERATTLFDALHVLRTLDGREEALAAFEDLLDGELAETPPWYDMLHTAAATLVLRPRRRDEAREIHQGERAAALLDRAATRLSTPALRALMTAFRVRALHIARRYDEARTVLQELRMGDLAPADRWRRYWAAVPLYQNAPPTELRAFYEQGWQSTDDPLVKAYFRRQSFELDILPDL